MTIIKRRSSRVPIVRHICRLTQPNRDMLLAYARFIGDSPDYVVNQLIETILAKDREFVASPGDQTPDAHTPLGGAEATDATRGPSGGTR